MKRKVEIKIKDGNIKNMLSKFVEKVAKQHIMDIHEEIIKENIKDAPEKLSVNYFEPKSESKKALGRTGSRSIARWHGDFVMMVHTPKEKVAFVFEIKFGHTFISMPQHRFFREIVREPERFHPKLNRAVITIVHCYNLDLEKRTLDIVMEPYREN